MMPHAWLLAYIMGPLFALAQVYQYGVSMESLAPRWDNQSRIVVNRLPFREDGSVPLRLEIRELIKDKYQWELFILAMNMLQYKDQEDPLSFYQIAGIHGVPFAPWNGVSPVPGAELSGYCTHSSVLFPMWHRPYLALFEQQLYSLVNKIAGLYQDPDTGKRYQEAALEFRMPYWDWAAPAPPGEPHFPVVFWLPTLLQTGPNGIQEIRNPLNSYLFRPLYDGVMPWTPLKYWNETKRAPDMFRGMKDPPSQNEKVNESLLGKLPEIQQRLFILFSSYKDFNAFSNKVAAMEQGLSSWDSIESIHDIIHIYGGLKGHMTYVPLSSFDPLFFLHHANTDRLVAMWQALNPMSWVRPMAAGETSYTTLRGSIQTSSTPLTPFLITTRGDYWTSDLARTTEMFGYSYPDTDMSYRKPDEVRRDIVLNVLKSYGFKSPSGLKLNGKFPTAPNPARVKFAQGVDWQGDAMMPNLKDETQLPHASAVFQDNQYTEWVANVRVNVEALDGLFGIHFFVGENPADSSKWETAANHMGSVGIFAMDRNTGSQSMISGTLPLTTALIKLVGAGTIRDLSPGSAGQFLQQKLRFAIKGSDDRVVDPSEVAGLYIVITSSEVTAPKDGSELPIWGEPVQRFEMQV